VDSNTLNQTKEKIDGSIYKTAPQIEGHAAGRYAVAGTNAAPELAPIKPRPQVLPTARGMAKEAAKFMRYEFERDNPEAVLLIEAMNKNLEVAFTFVDGTIIKSRVAAYGKYNIGLEDGSVIYKVGLKSIKICEATDA